MAVSYNKLMSGFGAAAAAGAGILVAAVFSGHVWQIATGGALLGGGTIGGVALFAYTHFSRNKDQVIQTLKNSSDTRIWSFADDNGKKVMVVKDKNWANNNIKIFPADPIAWKDITTIGKTYTENDAKQNLKWLEDNFKRVVVFGV